MRSFVAYAVAISFGFIPVLAHAVLAHAVPAHDGTVPFRPGAWQIRMHLPEFSSMPPQVREEMQSALPDLCIRPNQKVPPLPQEQQYRCRIQHESMVGNRARVVYACNIHGQTMRGLEKIRVAPDGKSFVEKYRVLQGQGAGLGMGVLRAHWVGPVCPSGGPTAPEFRSVPVRP
ncbi:DUF3617 domain-containing protein [Acidithiobacillus caldus]